MNKSFYCTQACTQGQNSKAVIPQSVHTLQTTLHVTLHKALQLVSTELEKFTSQYLWLMVRYVKYAIIRFTLAAWYIMEFHDESLLQFGGFFVT